MIEIDGALGEGGGQIVRSSLALSLVTGQAVRIVNIRAKRARPGLQPQHLTGVLAAAQIGKARVQGAKLSSTALTFEPGPVCPGSYHFAIGTAGATSLVLHTIYLPLAWQTSGPSEITLEGGTHVNASPSCHFLQQTWCSHLHRLGLDIQVDMDRAGFYPRGGGQIRARIQPCTSLRPLEWDWLDQPIHRVHGLSAVAGLPMHIARRQARRAEVRLRDQGIDADLTLESWEGGPGTVLSLVAKQPGVSPLFSSLGERGKPAERVADEAVDALLKHRASRGAIDRYSADQLVLPLALAQGRSQWTVAEVTPHLRTNLEVIRAFVPISMHCSGKDGEPGVVTIG